MNLPSVDTPGQSNAMDAPTGISEIAQVNINSNGMLDTPEPEMKTDTGEPLIELVVDDDDDDDDSASDFE